MLNQPSLRSVKKSCDRGNQASSSLYTTKLDRVVIAFVFIFKIKISEWINAKRTLSELETYPMFACLRKRQITVEPELLSVCDRD